MTSTTSSTNIRDSSVGILTASAANSTVPVRTRMPATAVPRPLTIAEFEDDPPTPDTAPSRASFSVKPRMLDKSTAN